MQTTRGKKFYRGENGRRLRKGIRKNPKPNMKKLRIAQIAPVWFSIPPKRYGGTERIISYLTEELVERGHDVTLFASGDSQTKAKLVAVNPDGIIESGGKWGEILPGFHGISVACAQAAEFDVMHSHVGLWSAFFQPLV